MKRRQPLALIAALVICAAQCTTLVFAANQSTAFTYQGQLNAGGVLPSGQAFYFTFALYDAASGGNLIGTPVPQAIVIGANGLFTTDLDFGQIFDGAQYWLEIRVGTTPANEQALAARQPINAVPVAQYALNVPVAAREKLIQFSTGQVLNGASVVSVAPVLMGFGNSRVETIGIPGESTLPPEAAGFSFPVPHAGTIQDLQVSADLLVASISSINTIGLRYEFTVFRAPSTPNSGTGHIASAYVTTPLTSSVQFGFPDSILMPGNFYSATNGTIGAPVVVAAGDRIGIRVRTMPATDPSAADITQLSFSATVSYVPEL
jgi:hypothetical protein